MLHETVNVAEAGDGRAATVGLDVTYQTLSAAGLLGKLDRGESLSLTGFASLHRSDEVSRDQLARSLSDAADAAVGDGRIQS